MAATALAGIDRRDGRVYEMPADLPLAVDVALATGRPLLLRGEPGSGKSSLAPFLARSRRLRYYEQVVTSRTQATDLLWSFDHIRRLADAQRKVEHPVEHYVKPGPLWRALAPTSANEHCGDDRDLLRRDEQDDVGPGAVLLIDEIDKADPDLPNGLLVPIGSQEFEVAETGTPVRREPGVDSLLIVITTNEERELPDAFLRRCVTFRLPDPEPPFLRRAASRHLATKPGADVRQLIEALIDELMAIRKREAGSKERRPNVAEFLDALRACLRLEVGPADPRWESIRDLTFVKPRRLGR